MKNFDESPIMERELKRDSKKSAKNRDMYGEKE
jgi:hypothetical protein